MCLVNKDMWEVVVGVSSTYFVVDSRQFYHNQNYQATLDLISLFLMNKSKGFCFLHLRILKCGEKKTLQPNQDLFLLLQ